MCDTSSQHSVCISLVRDRRNVTTLATVTEVPTPVTTIAVIASGIIIYVTTDSNQLDHVAATAVAVTTRPQIS